MIVHYLTNNTYFKFGVKYSEIKWLNEWYAFLKLYENERKESKWINEHCIGYIISWYDKNVLQRIGIDNDVSIVIKLRIAVCMINNISPNKLSPEMKYWFMQCLWDTYYKVHKAYVYWYGKWIAKLPF